MVSVTHLILRFAIVQNKFQQINKNKINHINDNHIEFEVSLHFLGIWPTVWRFKILKCSVSKFTIFSSLAAVVDECEPYSRKGGRKKMMIHHKGYNHRSAKSLSKLLKTQYALTQNLTWIMARTALF